MRYMINALLTIAIIILAYMLYQTIAEPIRFQNAKQKRYSAVIERLEKIKQCQFAFKNLKGGFAPNFDTLLQTLKTDTFRVIQVLGNPDDTSQEVRRDTLLKPVRDSLFASDYPIDSLPYIPYSRGKTFAMDAGKIKKSKVDVPVFEVKAYDTTFLYDQPRQFIEKDHALTLGSMSEAIYAGNWE